MTIEANITESEQTENAKEDGDVHDGDSGDYLFTLDKATGLPATLQILHDGYWYTYKIDGRMEDKEEVINLEISSEATDTIEPNIDPLKDL